MKILERYDEYKLDLILESIKNDTSMLVISERLEDKINRIDHPIAKKIIEISNKRYYEEEEDKYLITLLDINNKVDTEGKDVLDSISFYQSNKVIQKIAQKMGLEIQRGEKISEYNLKNIYNNIKLVGFGIMSETNKSETTLGRIVRKLFDTEFKDHEIGDFVEKYKSIDIFNEADFELVSGEDIVYWYNERRYTDGKGPLNESCMRYDRCAPYLEFYAKNEDVVKLLIMKNTEDDSKIIGRAVVWLIETLDGVEVENRYFMDRIYYTNEYIKELFIKYATNKSWLYKKLQNMEIDVPIIDTVTNKQHSYVVVSDVKDNEEYPYLDTLKFYDGYYLTNNINSIDKDSGKKLEDTYGEHINIGYYIAFYDEWVDVENNYDYAYCEWIDDYRYHEDCYNSEFYDVDIANDYAEKHMVDCTGFCDDGGDNYRLPEDAFYSKYYGTHIANDFKDSMVKCFYFDYTNVSDAYRLEKDTIEINGKISTIDYAKEHFYHNKEKDVWFEDGVWSELYDSYINREEAISVIVNKETGEKDWRYSDDETWYYDEDKHKYYAK